MTKSWIKKSFKMRSDMRKELDNHCSEEMIKTRNLLHRIEIAPMMKVTNRPFRVLMRYLTKKTTL